MVMKILYGVTKSNFGGAQKYVFELANFAKNNGYDVSVVCGGNGLLVEKLEEVQIPVHKLDSLTRDISIVKELKSIWLLYKTMRKVRPDVVHLNSPKLGGLGALVARLARVRTIIYTNHGWPFKEHRPFWQIWLITFFSWITILLNDHMIVLSKTEYNMVIDWPFISNKLQIIANGIDSFAYLPTDEARVGLLGEEKARTLAQTSAFVFGNIAELHRNKGYIYALQGIHTFIQKYNSVHAVDSLENKPIHFIIVSTGEDFEKLKNMTHNLGIEEYVSFVGYIKDARKYIRAFDVLLMTSVKEGLPYTILEAGFAKVPIIATSVGSIPEIIIDKHTGYLIPPRDQNAIAQAIDSTLQNQKTMQEYADKTKKIIDLQFDFNIQAEKVLRLYN